MRPLPAGARQHVPDVPPHTRSAPAARGATSPTWAATLPLFRPIFHPHRRWPSTKSSGRRSRTPTSPFLEGIDHRPIVSVPVASELTGLTLANADTLVKQFTDLRLLGEITGRKRDRRFAYRPYFDLLFLSLIHI